MSTKSLTHVNHQICTFNDKGRYSKMSTISMEVLKCLVLSVWTTAQLDLVVIGAWYTPVDKLKEQQIKDFMRGICLTMEPRQLKTVTKR